MNLTSFLLFFDALQRFSKQLFSRTLVIGFSRKQSKLIVISAIDFTMLFLYGVNMLRHTIQFNLGVNCRLFIENIYAIPNDNFVKESIITTCRNVCFIIATIIDSFIVTTLLRLADNNIFGFLPK